MGILRVFLALTVCINHYISFPMFNLPLQLGPGARLAVEIFFVISGFYMALILSEKYTGKGGAMRFYTNRILRLYPAYLLLIGVYAAINVVLFVQKGQVVFAKPITDTFLAADWFTRVWMVVANLTFVGQDAAFLFSFCPDVGGPCLGGPGSLPAGMLMLAIPQAWSVEVELMFYLFAPLFVTWRTKYLTGVVLALMAVRLYLYTLPIDEFWQFRFPPVAVGLFLMGVLAYRVYAWLKANPVAPAVLWGVNAAFFAYMLAFPWIPGDYVKAMLCYPFSFVCIPALFYLTRKNELDRVIGELSYPVYLVHHMVIMLVFYFITPKFVSIFYALFLTLAVSYALHRFVQAPIERYRQARARQTG